MANSQIGNVELAVSNLGYGGGFVLQPNGDFALALDSIDSADATTQRLRRLILTNARVVDDSGNPIAPPDDRFNPGYGASVRALVGESIGASLENALKTRIASAIAKEPGIAKNPAPTIATTDLGQGYLGIDVSVTTITGQLVTLPTETVKVN